MYSATTSETVLVLAPGARGACRSRRPASISAIFRFSARRASNSVSNGGPIDLGLPSGEHRGGSSARNFLVGVFLTLPSMPEVPARLEFFFATLGTIPNPWPNAASNQVPLAGGTSSGHLVRGIHLDLHLRLPVAFHGPMRIRLHNHARPLADHPAVVATTPDVEIGHDRHELAVKAPLAIPAIEVSLTVDVVTISGRRAVDNPRNALGRSESFRSNSRWDLPTRDVVRHRGRPHRRRRAARHW